jgi:aromatic-L-amino-acid/L-tryptophan decarboxylase
VFYVSADCHLAWVKIAHEAGIGRSAVRLVATDGSGRMDVAALGAAGDKDVHAGCIPVLIVATAGTTNAGMIDPLAPCADIAGKYGAWYHVDAAWGGGAIASERVRPELAGIERADSVTIDAHKWLATTMGCGMFLTRHPAVLPEAFQVNNSFMPSQAPSADPYMTSMQWSRRFLGLRLFLTLAAAGWQGYGDHIDRAVANAETLRALMVQRGWSVVNASPLAVVCLLPPPGSAAPAVIADRVVRSGAAWVSAAQFEGQSVVRACVTHGETSAQDVAALAAALEGQRLT